MNLTAQTRNRMFFMTIIAIAVAVASAFGIVWMQQQINRTAKHSQQIEREMEETMRRLRTLDERIASLHQPVVLQGKVAGVLRPSLENQIVWVEDRQVGVGRAYAATDPYEVSMDLALLDFNAQR